MVVYSIIMIAIAALFLALGLAIHQGNTKLIHDYHQARVKESERRAYGRAFAKGMFAIGATLLLSGAIALLDQGSAAVAVLFCGLIVSMAMLVKAQKKYNGGIF